MSGEKITYEKFTYREGTIWSTQGKTWKGAWVSNTMTDPQTNTEIWVVQHDDLEFVQGFPINPGPDGKRWSTVDSCLWFVPAFREDQ